MSSANKINAAFYMLLLYVMADGGKTMKSGNISPSLRDWKWM
jgi:hypothetical protein